MLREVGAWSSSSWISDGGGGGDGEGGGGGREVPGFDSSAAAAASVSNVATAFKSMPGIVFISVMGSTKDSDVTP